MSLTKATYSMISGAPVNILDYGASSSASASVNTAAIQAAIDYCKSFSASQNEINLIWPAGTYKVTSLNYVGAERVTNISNGAVNIIGTSSGGMSIINVDGGTSTFTRSLNWQGLFGISTDTGASYNYGVYINGLVGGRWEMSVSGNLTTNSVYIDYSFNNTQLDFIASNSSGLAIATIYCGSNNVNQNSFNCRTTGAANLSVASIGIVLTGNANKLTGDFSSSQIGIKLDNARGTVITSPYMELVKYGVVYGGNSLGTTVIGGLYEVDSNGAAFDLTSSQNSTIIGPRIFGNASGTNRTAFLFGTACYGLNVLSPDIDSTTIDTISSGTYRGNQLPTQFNVLDAQWVSFPATQVASTDPNTLDDYEEGTWTPAKTTGTAYTSAVGKYVKVGNLVTATFSVQFAVETNASSSAMSSFPFSTGSSASEVNGLAVGYQSASVNVGGSLASTTMTFRQIGTGVTTGATITQMSGAFVTGTMNYVIV